MILHHKLLGAVVGGCGDFYSVHKITGCGSFCNCLQYCKPIKTKNKNKNTSLTFFEETKLLGKSQLGDPLIRDALGPLM